MPTARVLVADHDAAERVVNELVRNHLIAHAGPGSGHDLAVLDSGSADPADPYDTVVLPGVSTSVTPRRCETRLLIGQPAGMVIVVPGTAADRDGAHTLTAETFGRLRRAEDVARRGAVRAVILSGWHGSSPGPSEAEQMMRAWAGPDVPIILDEAARSTAENALCTAAIIGALGEVRDVVVVASWANALRLRLAFRAALRAHGLRPELSIVWGMAHGASWRPGIVGLFRLRQHLLAGRALLDQGLRHPG
jgi:uncharacterized SAM-binding protein YcdF (DUF218 family)